MRASYVLRKYGTSVADLETLLGTQDFGCAICRSPWQECPPAKKVAHEAHFLHHLCVDHDHKTGGVRGLLCNACNTAIGLLGENVSRLRSAERYLLETRGKK